MMEEDKMRSRRFALVITIIIGSAVGLVWDTLAGLILFRSYSFFESVVISLLVMILSSIATMRADFEPLAFIQRTAEKNDDPASKVSELMRETRSIVKGIFYGVAFLMALAKLVLALTKGS
jgi:hypothetical protein